MWYATLPPPHSLQMAVVAKEPLIQGARYNTGAKTPYSRQETIERILAQMGKKEFWLDIKGGQPRIEQWSAPIYGRIILNHAIISLNLPARIIFRHEDKATEIVAFNGSEIFVDPPPARAIGQGQAVNIHGTNLVLDGYLTADDIAFIETGRDMGIHRYMLSYVEKESDIADVVAYDPKAEIVAKIETPKGLEFVKYVYPSFKGKIRLMAACDDLFINIEDTSKMLGAINSIVEADPQAIAASRLFMSLQDGLSVDLPDLGYYCLLKAMGYESFMLSDRICSREASFSRAMKQIRKIDGEKNMEWIDRVRDNLKRFVFWR